MKSQFPKKAVHGGTVLWHTFKGRGELLDFSANLNPYPPDVDWKPDPAVLGDYPDDRYERLKTVIGRTFGRDISEIAVGNGSVELIRTFAAVVLDTGDRFFVENPTFGEYDLAARLAGAEKAADPSAAVVRFCCNPNNPTGTLRRREEVVRLLEDAAASGTHLFLDEAFIELSDPGQSLVDLRHENLFVLRSLTKSFAVPGIRFGYGFGDPDLIERIEVARMPWTVNAFAEAYAIEAFARYGDLEESRTAIARERSRLCGELDRLSLAYGTPAANYILIALPTTANEMTERLLSRNILVRDCSSFGLPEHIRIAVRTREENRELIEALEACLP
ncbi:histidinol-phosphate aminotransferase family protein [Methanoculleus sp. FWC-SCC1]|uniref:Histidinol-phosphate aminotransferase family protein n=1 Tax=Methanoculleus frigidifontis TaxID=2584085 RepID=A0ABT8M6E7_9EURY|nr:histidinol-phosphate transaminase [Methanoculleus sp. FWC-SCC1]MDN7023512.1 histidinol-phosphate aminotransferase family protein [Methanoculleus sp. FWC-SCC1]